MSLDQEFEQASQDVKKLPNQPNAVLLRLYALYKQASLGDNDTKKPGMLDVRGKAKWEAWKKLAGKSQEAAKQEYISFVKELEQQHS